MDSTSDHEVNRASDKMEIPHFLTIFQSGLSVIGFLAISAWLIKWVKGFHDRSAELSGIDKDIREALRQSIETQKQLHDYEKKKFESQLMDLAEQVTVQSKTLAEKEAIALNVIKAVNIGIPMIIAIQNDLVKEEFKKIDEQIRKVGELLVVNQAMTKDQFLRLLKREGEGKDVSEMPRGEDEILWRLGAITYGAGIMAGGGEAMTLVVPSALNFIFQNPGASKKEIGNAISGAIKKRSKEYRQGVIS